MLLLQEGALSASMAAGVRASGTAFAVLPSSSLAASPARVLQVPLSRPAAARAGAVPPLGSAAICVGAAAAVARRGRRRALRRGACQVAAALPPQRAAEPEIDPRPTPDQPAKEDPVRMPMIDTGKGTIDVNSQLLKDRILFLNGQVNDEIANILIAQMRYLANQDEEKDITLYINSPGGSVSAGFAIFDSMQLVKCDVSTICLGSAASMGAFLLGAGTKGKRKALPNARIMIHQPLGGAGGQAADIQIQAEEILFLRDILNVHLADFTGQDLQKIEEDCDRDYFMTAEDAKEYGLVDEVVTTKTWPRLQKPQKQDII